MISVVQASDIVFADLCTIEMLGVEVEQNVERPYGKPRNGFIVAVGGPLMENVEVARYLSCIVDEETDLKTISCNDGGMLFVTYNLKYGTNQETRRKVHVMGDFKSVHMLKDGRMAVSIDVVLSAADDSQRGSRYHLRPCRSRSPHRERP